ncbi:MAG: hypothetical protein ACRC8M_01565 [Cetobacterium sp.]|uniref:hypothetical protein n=1 Tax=Cetobacterium sp. TaxID=2071632 RepID=UPI003F34C9E2
MKNNLSEYISEAEDIEILGANRLLIVTKRQNILLNGVSQTLIDECFEVFGKRFRKNKNKKSGYLKVIWLDDEIEYLKESYLKKEIKEIAVIVNKSEYQVHLMLGRLRLIEKKEWSESELEFLKNNIDSNIVWLASELNRGIGSVKSKKRVIKLEMCSQQSEIHKN